MPIWSTTPPEAACGPALPVKRTPPTGSLTAIVTSENLIGCYTHFYHGHTIPCEGDNCKAHAEGIPYRWHAYLAALSVRDNLHFLFETTAQAAENFVTYRDAHKSLRGCLFQARRLHAKHNGRVLIQCKPADLSQLSLPIAPDLEKTLAVLWNLPDVAITVDGMDPKRKIPIVRKTTAADPTTSPPPATETYDQAPAALPQPAQTSNPELPPNSTPVHLLDGIDPATGRPIPQRPLPTTRKP